MQTAGYYPNSNFQLLVHCNFSICCSAFLTKYLAISSYLLVLQTMAQAEMSSWFMVTVLLITTPDISH